MVAVACGAVFQWFKRARSGAERQGLWLFTPLAAIGPATAGQPYRNTETLVQGMRPERGNGGQLLPGTVWTRLFQPLAAGTPQPLHLSAGPGERRGAACHRGGLEQVVSVVCGLRAVGLIFCAW
jgi:hypothetical protein